MDGACKVEFTLTPSDELWTVNNIQQRRSKNGTKKKKDKCNGTDGGKFNLQQQITNKKRAIKGVQVIKENLSLS